MERSSDVSIRNMESQEEERENNLKGTFPKMPSRKFSLRRVKSAVKKGSLRKNSSSGKTEKP